MRKIIPLLAGIALIIAGGLVPVSTVLIVFILPETFASTARIAPAVTEPSAIATEMEKLRSRAVLEQVITNLNLKRKYAEKFKEEGEQPLEITYGILRQRIEVGQGRGTTLIGITVSSEDRAEAATIANEIAKVYRDSPLAAKGPDAKSVAQIIDEAVPGLRPVRPNKVLAFAIATGVGLLLEIFGFALVLAFRKRTRSADLPSAAR